jgi:2-polyprenyl-3-methyl-5-hydroxy-6-metoxy-1,4-benzoquinol methylase
MLAVSSLPAESFFLFFNIAADAALQPFMAGTHKIKQFVKSHDLTNKLHAQPYLAPQNLGNAC